MRVTPERQAALEVLLAVERGRRLDRALEAQVLDVRRRPWVHRVTYGVQRLRGRLDHLLEGVLSQPLADARPELRAVLRVGLYELLETEAPPYAVLSQSVEAARSFNGEGPARLTNAVLRKLSRMALAPDLASRFPDPASDPLGFLTHWGSHPDWLLERWLSRWSAPAVTRLVEANNRIPALYLRPRDGDLQRLQAALSAEDVEAERVAYGADCLRVGSVDDIGALLERTHAFVQDPGAALVVRAMSIQPGDLVADLCAAPGGKSRALHAAGATVLAADRSEARLRMLPADPPSGTEAATPSISRLVADGLSPALRAVPCVLLDAPCTGTGTLARHPDGRWRLRPGVLSQMASLQRRLLDAASEVVTSGGLLVYSTCSLEPEENVRQIQRFLARHLDFSLEAIPGVDTDLLDEAGCLEVLPQKTGFDGAFAARLRRRA